MAVDRVKARVLYITTDKTFAQIARELKCSAATIAKLADKEDWKKAREEYKKRVYDIAIESVTEKRTETLSRLATITDRMIEEGLKSLNDPDQYYRHVVQKGKDKEFEAEERIFKKKDTKAYREDTQALRDLVAIARNLYGIATDEERERREMARKKLEIEEKKLEIQTPDREIVVKFQSAMGISAEEANEYAELPQEGVQQDENQS